MPFEVQLTQVGSKEAFDKAVNDHITNLVAFRRVINKPRPMAHPLVEAAIKRIQKPGHPDDFAADYVIVDDLPKEPEVVTAAEAQTIITLENKKHMLVQQLATAEGALKSAIVPRRKMRLMLIKNNAAALKIEEQRTEEDKQAMQEWLSIVSKFNAIELKAAEAEAAIEDLTEDNIDSWQLPELG